MAEKNVDHILSNGERPAGKGQTTQLGGQPGA